jgi:uncharacterized membrane protein
VTPRVISERDMKTNSFKSILLISLLGALITAGAYVLSIYVRLDPSDGAYQIGFHKLLLDPFVITIALTVAIPIGLIASPLLYFFLRHKNLEIVYPTIQLLTILAMFIIPGTSSPNHNRYVIIGGCTTMLIAALVFWAVPMRV